MKKIASSVGVRTVGRAGIVKNVSITIPLAMVLVTFRVVVMAAQVN